MITIKQHNRKWQIEIKEELWEFETRQEMEYNLKLLLDMKEQKGDLK